ncbi:MULTISPECIES: hypothetical protein [Acinetobacter]|uniref:hypothetical protein n=1 Tax=Acinetobacter TaxID=469 RepID=UPI0015D32862|nr:MULTISPECIES: hypothetical protein [Acinetobacter]MDM1286593.1 hypothetical protein [Acinetobacter indicus]QSG85120.1 hypothetical protein JYB86_03085 [Acinetobacter indicus]
MKNGFLNNLVCVFSIVFLTGCIETKSSDYLKPSDELAAIQDFVVEKKRELPVLVDAYTNWVDLKIVDNKLIYVYKINTQSISVEQAEGMKEYYYSGRKKVEICNSINNLLNIDIIYIYRYLNSSDEILVDIPFDSGMCEN